MSVSNFVTAAAVVAWLYMVIRSLVFAVVVTICWNIVVVHFGGPSTTYQITFAAFWLFRYIKGLVVGG